MTEYDCTAVIDDTKYDFQTLAAVTTTQAIKQFDQYLFKTHNVVLELASHVEFKRVAYEG